MRRVLAKVPAGQMTPLEQQCRKWLGKNVAAFMAKYADLEGGKLKAAPAAVVKVEEVEKPLVDEKQERLVDVMNKLLDDGEAEGWK